MPHFLFWFIPLILIFGVRGRWGGPGRWHGGLDRREREYIAELQQVVEDQRVHIEGLEERVARLEDGMEFAERLLAERSAAAAG